MVTADPRIPPTISGDRDRAELVVWVVEAGATEALRIPLRASALALLVNQGARILCDQVQASVVRHSPDIAPPSHDAES